MKTSQCPCGDSFEIVRKKGRPPTRCPKCRETSRQPKEKALRGKDLTAHLEEKLRERGTHIERFN